MTARKRPKPLDIVARDLVDRLWAVDVCDRKAVPIVRSVLGQVVADALREERRKFDLAAHIKRQRAFSERTFGPITRRHAVVAHIRTELAEIEAAPDDLEEWIDVVILALDGAWRTGASPQEIVAALIAKQTKNEARRWPDWRTVEDGKPIEHDRSGEERYCEIAAKRMAQEVLFSDVSNAGSAA